MAAVLDQRPGELDPPLHTLDAAVETAILLRKARLAELRANYRSLVDVERASLAVRAARRRLTLWQTHAERLTSAEVPSAASLRLHADTAPYALLRDVSSDAELCGEAHWAAQAKADVQLLATRMQRRADDYEAATARALAAAESEAAAVHAEAAATAEAQAAATEARSTAAQANAAASSLMGPAELQLVLKHAESAAQRATSAATAAPAAAAADARVAAAACEAAAHAVATAIARHQAATDTASPIVGAVLKRVAELGSVAAEPAAVGAAMSALEEEGRRAAKLRADVAGTDAEAAVAEAETAAAAAAAGLAAKLAATTDAGDADAGIAGISDIVDAWRPLDTEGAGLAPAQALPLLASMGEVPTEQAAARLFAGRDRVTINEVCEWLMDERATACTAGRLTEALQLLAGGADRLSAHTIHGFCSPNAASVLTRTLVQDGDEPIYCVDLDSVAVGFAAV